MIKRNNFSDDFEREAAKDSVYLLEEQQAIMKEIIEDEARKPAKIYIVQTLETAPKQNDTANILPF
jgi:hypothetical protein